MKGKFFVIDGVDGSGKKTQFDLLATRLQEEGYEVKMMDFPRYGEFSAVFVEKYLNGYFGKAHDVTPKQASLFYALDRYAASAEMKQWLEEGKHIISNRYTSANVGHHGGKISDIAAREAYIEWLFDLEFNILGIPKPDTTFFLHVPHAIGMELVKQKTIQRDYIESEKKIDIHEEDKDHMKAAEESYLYAAAKYPDWETITCCTNQGNLRQILEIHEEIWEHVSGRLT